MNKYKCTKCGADFEIEHYVDAESAVCTPCFKHISSATSSQEYNERKEPMKLDLYGWFPVENEETLSRLIKENNIKTVLEIGCFLGKSTKFFVEQGCTVISIDTFEGAKDINASAEVQKRLPTMFEQFKFNLKELGIEDKVTVFKGSSVEAFISEPEYRADLIFIDGSHEYGDVVADIQDWYGRADKVLCGDDYTNVHPQVKQAVDELLPDANTNQRVWYVIK